MLLNELLFEIRRTSETVLFNTLEGKNSYLMDEHNMMAEREKDFDNRICLSWGREDLEGMIFVFKYLAVCHR